MIFEYTASGTPQQNGKVERKIATILSKTRSMMIDAGIKQYIRNKLWAEGISTATKLEGILSINGGLSAVERFFGKLPGFVKHLRTFGEMGVAADLNRKLLGKLSDK